MCSLQNQRFFTLSGSGYGGHNAPGRPPDDDQVIFIFGQNIGVAGVQFGNPRRKGQTAQTG